MRIFCLANFSVINSVLAEKSRQSNHFADTKCEFGVPVRANCTGTLPIYRATELHPSSPYSTNIGARAHDTSYNARRSFKAGKEAELLQQRNRQYMIQFGAAGGEQR